MRRSSRRSDRGSSGRRRYPPDDDYTRDLTPGREKSVHRQLFNPNSDNPIAFNAQAKSVPEVEQRTPHRQPTSMLSSASNRRSYLNRHKEGSIINNETSSRAGLPLRSISAKSSQRPCDDDDDEDDEVVYARRGPSKGKLWHANESSSKHSPPKNEQPPTHKVVKETKSPVLLPPQFLHRKETSSQSSEEPSTVKSHESPTAISSHPIMPKAKTVPKPEIDPHKKLIKALLYDLHIIETKIAELSTASKTLVFFNERSLGNEDHPANVRNRDGGQFLSYRRSPPEPAESSVAEQAILTPKDIELAEKYFEEKIDLHMKLAYKYLDVLQLDYNFAEKKSLESLCWKRAIYSLVDLFRQSFKTCMSMRTGAENDLAKDEHATDEEIAYPVIDETGMTMVKLDAELTESTIKDQAIAMLKECYVSFLDKADEFYRDLMVMLRNLDQSAFSGDGESYMEHHEHQLQGWRRTVRSKWYKCVPIRGDLARYKWAVHSSLKKARMLVDDDSLSTNDSFAEAWQWYHLTSWLMPGTGKPYFHLSLLLNDPIQRNPSVKDDLHKLYFSTRSLMVRRNGFVNAREGMLVLFESNRRWYQSYIDLQHDKNRRKKSKQKTNAIATMSDKSNNAQAKQVSRDTAAELTTDDIIAGTFVRLHGMMFTKIGLDQFAQVKRRFFDALLSNTMTSCEPNPAIHAPTCTDRTTHALSGRSMFWLETAILCLSSLYRYEFSTAQLSRVTSFYRTRSSLSDGSAAVLSDSATENITVNASVENMKNELKESVVFSHGIDLTCQIAVELIQRYIDSTTRPAMSAPTMPQLPKISMTLCDNEKMLFGRSAVNETMGDSSLCVRDDDESGKEDDQEDWMVYLQVLLQWMVMSGVCVRSLPREKTEKAEMAATLDSVWEYVISEPCKDTAAVRHPRGHDTELDSTGSIISPSFWSLLMEFLNTILHELSDDMKYELINYHLLDHDEPSISQEHDTSGTNENHLTPADRFAQQIQRILGNTPLLPEEHYLLGLGWIDDITGSFTNTPTSESHQSLASYPLATQRRLKLLHYGFTLVQQMKDVVCFDPVEETFFIAEYAASMGFLDDDGPTEHELLHKVGSLQVDDVDDMDEEEFDHHSDDDAVVATLAEMDDAVLLSNETDSLDEEDDADTDMLSQLKKRRDQLQQMMVSVTDEQRFGYRKLPTRVKEREARLKRLEEKLIPEYTTLVLDTNCFIGHLNHVKKLMASHTWIIVIPLVVITELDGLCGNSPPLGTTAMDALKLIEDTLADKQRYKRGLRIQTSHNNFLSDISIRSEQFVFGETDKNLDDLVLSTCLWWNRSAPDNGSPSTCARVCLVTGDRNLSVKARARDVEVVPMSGVMQLTRKYTS
ncbi:uncharacterized protein BYT42DRAFT_641709 [Radiomyces spectabilis]|uniref:uncharacterized protein n=1 Tax=Radiomyces spectabilis TaxID=64574 RepID=UPI00222084EB|nr:uncharacterized protein BYT42DRAFT_641709 [Radiomyces spectabilis]KAI8391194.1 hypothetical protein BYT42DRAFT_641709 [Radiomyces spectabilis]